MRLIVLLVTVGLILLAASVQFLWIGGYVPPGHAGVSVNSALAAVGVGCLVLAVASAMTRGRRT